MLTTPSQDSPKLVSLPDTPATRRRAGLYVSGRGGSGWGGGGSQARVPRELLNRLEPYFTAGFRKQFEVDEMADAGDDEGERNWKLIAKKRINGKTNAVDGATLL